MAGYVVDVTGTYDGELRCTALHGPSGGVLKTDAPRDHEGLGESFSPTDLVATALGTCIATVIGIVARRRGVDVGGMRFRVTKEMISDPQRRIGRLETTIWLPASIAAAERSVLERAGRACPVRNTLRPDVEAPIVFVYE